MADVVGAFFEGRNQARTEKEHNQALDENKLRMMILKHQISGLKIEDTLRKRALEMQQLQLLEGQPEDSLDTVTQQPNLPSKSFAGSMTGLPGAPGVTSEVSPNAQSQNLGTNPVRRRASVTISGVPEWGVNDLSVRPRSAEDIVRASIYQKAMEPRVLNEGDILTAGGQTIAKGNPKTFAPQQPTRASVAVAAAGGDMKKADESLRGAGAQNSMSQVTVSLDGEQAEVLRDRQGNYFDLDKNPIRNAGTRIKTKPATPATPLQQEAASRQEYDLFKGTYNTAHPRPNLNDILVAQQQNEPIPRNPKAPPTYEKWKVMSDEERQQVIANPDARIDDAEMTKRQSTTKAKSNAAPAGEKNGQPKKFTAQDVSAALKNVPKPAAGRLKRVTLTDGSVWNVFPDGQYEQVFEK